MAENKEGFCCGIDRFCSRSLLRLFGRILGSLTGLALPIMATSLVQTAYNLTDMAWIGRVGSSAVAAVGAAGMYTWFSTGIVTLARMGGQIKVAHSLVLALGYALTVLLLADRLIGFFGLSSERIMWDAQVYLRITCGLILFPFLNQTLTGLFTAIGDSRTPFLANCTGLAVNMVLDPILIFGMGPFPRMEAAGAAGATVTAQIIVTLVLAGRAFQDKILFDRICLWKKTPFLYFGVIFKLGVPSSLQSMFYSGISMVLTKMVASWGDAAIAVQRVGGQVECISWMTAEGFGSAMNAFTGQNFGARFYDRVKKSYLLAMLVIGLWGTFTSCLLIFGAEFIFTIFIQESQVLPLGISYLELLTVGALQGLGKTLPSSVITIVLTVARIPLALVLTRTGLGLNGIWWALTLTSMAKGCVFVGYYLWVLKNLPGQGFRQGALAERKRLPRMLKSAEWRK